VYASTHAVFGVRINKCKYFEAHAVQAGTVDSSAVRWAQPLINTVLNFIRKYE
jgi:hypothetical protein